MRVNKMKEKIEAKKVEAEKVEKMLDELPESADPKKIEIISESQYIVHLLNQMIDTVNETSTELKDLREEFSKAME